MDLSCYSWLAKSEARYMGAISYLHIKRVLRFGPCVPNCVIKPDPSNPRGFLASYGKCDLRASYQTGKTFTDGNLGYTL